MRRCETCGGKPGPFEARQRNPKTGAKECGRCRNPRPHVAASGFVNLHDHTWGEGVDGDVLLRPGRYKVAAVDEYGTWVEHEGTKVVLAETHVASEDYPVLSDILVERPPLERQGSRRASWAGDLYCPKCGAKVEVDPSGPGDAGLYLCTNQKCEGSIYPLNGSEVTDSPRRAGSRKQASSEDMLIRITKDFTTDSGFNFYKGETFDPMSGIEPSLIPGEPAAIEVKTHGEYVSIPEGAFELVPRTSTRKHAAPINAVTWKPSDTYYQSGAERTPSDEVWGDGVPTWYEVVPSGFREADQGQWYWELAFWGPDDYTVLETSPMFATKDEAKKAAEAHRRNRLQRANGGGRPFIPSSRFDPGSTTRWSSRKHAHDSGDGETIYHCPMCGSGNVVGRSDGTVECAYCNSVFTVQVQPSNPNMPQTVDGQPYDIPGMPGQIDKPQPGDPSDPSPAGPPAGDLPPFGSEDEEASPEDDVEDGENPFAKGSARFITTDGIALPEREYIAHLARKHRS